MNCSKCGKPVAAGAPKCGACGTAASSSYSYDLAPEEEAKKKEEPAAAFMLPPGVKGPPAGGGAGPAKAPRSPERARGGAASIKGGGLSLKTMGLVAGVVLILVLLGMRMCGGPKTTLTMMSPKGTGTANVSNLITKTIPFQNVGEVSYRFKVESLDGDVRIGVPERGSRDKVTPEIVKTWSLTPVKKGETQVLEGKVPTGSYSLVITSESKKGLRVKFEYLVK